MSDIPEMSRIAIHVIIIAFVTAGILNVSVILNQGLNSHQSDVEQKIIKLEETIEQSTSSSVATTDVMKICVICIIICVIVLMMYLYAKWKIEKRYENMVKTEFEFDLPTINIDEEIYNG